MVKRYVISFVFTSVLCMGAQSSHAMGPRLIYVEPVNQGESLLGRYLYMGVIFASPNPAGFAGPSMKFAWGKTGKKFNISFVTGTRAMSFEGGVSYIKQDDDAAWFINAEHKGYAFEASFRLNAISVIGVFSKENTTIELGLGF